MDAPLVTQDPANGDRADRQDLSVCVPTYNRPRFLKWTLERLKADLPDAEINVSDDATPQPVRYVCGAPEGIRWALQSRNIGAFPNLLAALQMATRKYAVYCADDDYLLPERLKAACHYLDEHPEVSAYIAPCEIYDEVNGRAFWNAFKCEEQTFTEGMDLFNFIIASHIWPEHIVYRTPVPLKPRTRAYWAFSDLVDLLEAGPIHFSPVPFYRNCLVHPVGERVQLGNVQCLTHFDEYRAGLEVMAYGFFGQQPYKARRQIHDMISAFICQRMFNAAVLYERQGHELEATMLKKRLVIADPSRDAA